MYDDIKIKLSPYLGYSKNLMEFFVVIGYPEKIIKEIEPDITLLNEEDYDLSIISIVISDLALKLFNPDIIIREIYPDKPKIIKSDIKPKSTNMIFYSCFDTLDGEKKNLFVGYGLRFYEKYVDINQNEYYIPKAFAIFSQYPYFNTFNQICANLLNINYESENIIPFEILIYAYVNYIPSPIKNNLILKDLNSNIFIPRLTGYPYPDFDICKIFNIIPIKDFIKIYILIFLEIELLFFSPNIEQLSIFMYILYLLNYPLTDSNYFWFIKCISRKSAETGAQCANSTFTGVNSQFDWDFNFDNLDNLSFIIDMENKKNLITTIHNNKESKDINKLLKYINSILNHKKVDKSFFLSDILTSLKRKIKNVLKEYSKNNKNVESFFYIDQKIIQLNRELQEIFYDFILNILVILNKDFELDTSMTGPIKKRKYINPKISEEEKIFLEYSRNTIKYNTYFDLFIKDFKAADEIKVSLLFSDEYVNLKMKDTDKNIPDHIKYFNIMDNLYSLKPGNDEIKYNYIYNEFNERNKIINKNKEKKKAQLFALDQNIIKDFIFFKKNKEYYKLLQKQDLDIEIIDKMSVPLTIQNYFYQVLNQEYYLRSALVYFFSITFPLFSFQDSLCLLSEVFKGLVKIKYFQRYYIYIILKSIHKYYVVNEQNGQFPELILNNVINYCQFINSHLMNNALVPNKEIFLFLKKILNMKNQDNKINENINNQEKVNKHFIYQYKGGEFEKNIDNNAIIKEGDLLVFNYKGITIKHNLINSGSLMRHTLCSIHDDYFTLFNCNIEKINIDGILQIIINIAFYFLCQHFHDKSLADFLINSVILLKQFEKDLNIYKDKKSKNNEEINKIDKQNKINNNENNN